MSRNTNKLITGVLLALFVFAGVADISEGQYSKRRRAQARHAQAQAERVEQQQLAAIPRGPKRRVAVAGFNANAAFRQAYGDFDLGGGLSAMLTSALERSGRFIVVERQNLDGVLNEQRLGQDGLVHQPSAAQVGKLIGAQLLIYGSVTEMNERESGGGVNIGGGIAGIFGGSVSPRSITGHVAMVFKLVDSTTGRVVDTFRVSKKLKESSVDLSIETRHVNMTANTFKKTAIGKAAQKAIDKAVMKIIRASVRQPWSGLVVAVTDGAVIINGGKQAGIRPGDVFTIKRQAQTFTDPVTGEVLGHKEIFVGQITVTSVQDRMAQGTFAGNGEIQPKRGDPVRLLPRR